MVNAPTTIFQQAPADSPSFQSVWDEGVCDRRNLLAPRWCAKRRIMISKIKWDCVFASWDRINDHLRFAPQPHVRKLHALRRTQASTTTKGTWIYALWTAKNTKIYIGQTGARMNQRSVGTRGSEHIRLGSDFLRIQGNKLRVPSNVYRWVSRLGPESFVVTPLEWVEPHRADQAEKEWMTRWGISGLFNQDLPSVASRKWLFLTDRKIWKTEMASVGGNLLDVASGIINKDRPPSPYEFSPELLLSLLPATAKLLPAGQHRILYTRIANHFMIHHKAFIPYTIPVRIPLLSESEQSTIRQQLHSVIDRHGTWPPSLKAYVKSCIRIIVSRSRSVGDLLMRSSLTRMPTHVLSHPDAPCPCQQWKGTPGFHFHHGHMVFRDPSLVRHFHKKLNPAVFSQNMKNATLPSWKTLKDHVNTALNGIFPNLPDTRQDTAVDLVCALQTCCQSNYFGKIRAADKRIYEPYVEKQRKLLPDFLVVSPMDKATQVPLFACHHFWHKVHHDTFFQGGRYRELFRFSSHHDAQVTTAWSLIDSMSLCVLGRPSQVSRNTGLSPLSHDEQTTAFSYHQKYKPSVRLKNRISAQIMGQQKRVLSALPSPAAWPQLLTLGFSPTLSASDLKHAVRPPRAPARLNRVTQTRRGQRARPPVRGQPVRTRQCPAQHRAFTADRVSPRDVPFSAPFFKHPKSQPLKIRAPTTRLLPKHKWLDHDATAKIKLREVIQHHTHPFRQTLRHLGRALTLLWKFATSRPQSIEIVAMDQLLQFVRSHPPVGPAQCWTELDLVEMFPNIPRHVIPESVDFFWHQFCAGKPKPHHDLGFKIHKSGVKQLDAITRKSGDAGFHFMTYNDLMCLLCWDSSFNDRFSHYSSVLAQTTGTPIGGSCSAQVACLTLLLLETKLHQLHPDFPPVLRYRDNFLVIPDPPEKVNGYTIERIQRTLSEISGMELTVEGSGHSLDFLECTLSLPNGTPSVSMKRPVFQGYAGMSSPPSPAKLLDVFSPNTPRMLRSLVPNLVKKAAHYRLPATGTSFAHNISIIARTFLAKGYPVCWWKHCLFRKASSLDLLGPARAGVQTAMSSSQPTVNHGSTM